MPCYPSITEEQSALIRSAPLFFLATADPELASGPGGLGPVNVSPKGGVPLHILGPNWVAYLDYEGSGNETGALEIAAYSGHGDAGNYRGDRLLFLVANRQGVVASPLHAENTSRATELSAQRCSWRSKIKQICAQSC